MDEYFKDYARYEFRKAEQARRAAHNNFALNDFDTTVNRAYYAMFHIMTAAMALKSLQYSRHNNLIRAFRKEYIATGKLKKELSGIITKSENMRDQADYRHIEITKEDAAVSLERLDVFYDQVQPLLREIDE